MISYVGFILTLICLLLSLGAYFLDHTDAGLFFIIIAGIITISDTLVEVLIKNGKL